jgi:hypothetical protein
MSTALYAVSVISKTVVAGFGIRTFFIKSKMPMVLLVAVLATLASLGVIAALAWSGAPFEFLRHSNWLENWLGIAATGELKYLANVVALFIVIIVMVVFSGFLGFVLYLQREEKFMSSTRVFTTMAGNLLASMIALFILLFTHTPIPILGYSISLWWAAAAVLAILFLSSYLGGLSWAMSQDPPLPTVELTLTDENDTVGGEIIKGTLLDHSAGVWHFFDNRNATLTAIPDGKVHKVRILK